RLFFARDTGPRKQAMSTALIVDADRASRRVLSNIIEIDHEVATAVTGRSGLDLIAERTPDLIFLDLMLPDISGMEAVARVKRLAPRTPVIVLTAAPTSQRAIEAMQAGAH